MPEHVIATERIGGLVERYVPGRGAVWAETKLGVHERRFAVPLDPATGYPIGDGDELAMAQQAAAAAIEQTGIEAHALDGLWYVSCTQSDANRHFGRLALGLHAALGLRPCAFALELNAGCGGSLHAMSAAAAQMRGNNLWNVLIVAANMPSQYFRHWQVYARNGAWLSMYLFGDGAGAVVLRRVDGEPCGILAEYTANDPANPLMQFACPAGQNTPVYLIDSHRVALGFSRYARLALDGLQSRHPFRLEDVARFYFHQVNGVLLRNFVSELGIPEERVPVHVDRFGNLASAATLVLLDADLRAGAVRAGDRCVLCTVGAGAQYGAMLVEL